MVNPAIQVGGQTVGFSSIAAQEFRSVLLKRVGGARSKAHLQRGILPPSAGWHQNVKPAADGIVAGIGVS